DNFTVIADVENGKQALEFIEKNPVHIVLTDVCMPVIDGIELTSFLSNNQADIKVIVMSSYDDFKYVKETLKNGAVDYLLKHTITKETLTALINKTIGSISKEKNKELENAQNTGILKNLIKCEYLKNLILNNDHKKSITDYIKNTNLNLELTNCIIMVMETSNFYILTMTNSENEINKFIANLTNVASMALKEFEDSEVLYLGNGKIAIYLPLKYIKSELKVFQTTSGITQNINAALKKYFGILPKWGICNLNSHGLSIHEKYLSACENLTAEISTIDLNTKQQLPTLTIKQEKEILFAIDALDLEKTDKCIDDVLNENTHYSSSFLQIITGELLSVAKRICREFNLNIDDIYSKLNINKLFVENCSNTSEISNWLKMMFHEIINSHSIASTAYSPYVYKTIEYIKTHYKEDLTLDDIAQNINITPQYLSKIFKQETNQKLSLFIVDVRIEKAKSMLESGETNLKKISDDIGFSNYNYFLTVFKNTVGSTPTKYKKTLKNKN
ncbi:MAG: response regulator, partial [Oscillospiraceae bacterium]